MANTFELVTVKCEEEYSENEEDNYVAMETSAVIKQENGVNEPSDEDESNTKNCAIIMFDKLPYTMRQDKEKTMYKCKECTLEKSTLSILMKHINDIHPKLSVPPRGSAVYKCDRLDCNKIFCKHGQLTRHIIDKHINPSNEKKIKCILCNMSFEYNYQLKRHAVNIHLDKTPYQCDICKQYYVSKSHLTKHFRTHKNMNELVCTVCDVPFPNKHSLSCHVARSHSVEKAYKCHLCPKEYHFDFHLDTHLRTHDPTKGFPCGMCDRIFTNNFALQQHSRYRHTKTGKGETNAVESGVKPNKRKSGEIRTVSKKSVCDEEKDTPEPNAINETKGIDNVTDLEENHSERYVEDKIVEDNEHLKYESEASRRDSYDSDDIPLNIIARDLKGEEFIEVEPLILPEALLGEDFDDSSDRICQYCDAHFSKRLFLERHIQALHTNIYECNVCKKMFSSKKTLVHHSRIHKTTMFKCHACPKVFEYEHTLKTHIESHKTMSIKCNICYQSCEDDKVYHKHMMAHSTNGKVYSCNVCPKIFLEMSILKRHCSRVHNMSKALQVLKRDKMYM